MLGVAFGDERSDPTGAQRLSVWLGVVAAVGEERVGSAAWSSALATQRWDRLDERQQLGDVGGGWAPVSRQASGTPLASVIR